MLWAAGYFFRKTALYGISPLLLTFFTACIVSIVFACIFRFHAREISRAFKAHPWPYLALALSGVVIGSTCQFIALDHLDLGTTVVLENLQPVFTLILASIFLRERLSSGRLPWMFLALVASYVVLQKDLFDLALTTTSLRGVGAVVLAAFAWGLASVIGKHLTRV